MRNKSFLILILFLGFGFETNVLEAQRLLYLGSGLNLSYTAPDSLNFVVDRFNQTRGLLTRELPRFHFPVGVAFSGGAILNEWHFDLSWVGRTQTSRASGPTASSAEDLHLKFKMNSLNIGVGRKLLSGPKAMLFGGISTDVGVVRTLARSGDPSFIREVPWTLLTDQWAGANSVYLQGMIGELSETGVLLLIRPYYQFHWFRTDFLNTNAGVNPGTWFSDPQSLPSRGSNFGLTGMMVIYFSDL